MEFQGFKTTIFIDIKHKCRPCPFIQILLEFYPNFLETDFILILFRPYPNF